MVRVDSMPEPVPALHILASLGESLQYSLGLPSAEGQVCLPQQWLRDWHTQAQVALALLESTGAAQDRPGSRSPLPFTSGKEGP